MSLRGLSWVVVASALVALSPSSADACGGTFCDGGAGMPMPMPMPVDQTGENILFVMGDGFVEAHIQIQYDPASEAMNFAWIVPVLTVPEFSVGSERLILNLLDGTVPSYGFTTTNGCPSPGVSMSGASASSTSPTTDPTGFDTDDAGSTGGGPEVVLEEVVGAFEVTVLSGGTGDELVEWLDMNGYAQNPDAAPIVDEYLAENYLFAAFKLTNSATISEIHPIVLRFDIDEACVPLRLTRIASVDDMDIRTFFLAEHRVVPETYRHVVVNPLKLNWPGRASNYKAVITAAVDADQANGRAFVTEYAGPSVVVSTVGLFSATWDATVFETIAPTGVVAALEDQGLMSCSGEFGTTTGGGFGNECAYRHTLLRGLLNTYLPVPDGVDEVDFYGCLSCYEPQIDTDAWDSAEFAMALQERIIDPGAHAREVLDAYPTLTRMYTTMSGHEMVADPFFYENPDLADVDLRNQVASRRLTCAGEMWTLPDGRIVYLPNSVWPNFPDQMPWEEDVEEMMPAGAPMTLVDNTEQIDTLLAMWNCQQGYPPEECGGGATDGASDGSGGGTDGDTDTAGETSGGSGCGCHSGAGGLGFAIIAFMLAMGLARRRQTSTPDSGPVT